MKKTIISYDEYIKHKKISEALNAQIEEEALNESNFLTSILNFFKGLFDLFNNKELKKEAENSTEYIKSIEHDEDIPDEEVGDEVDGKRIRKYFTNAGKTITKQIEIDKEKGIRVSNELIKKIAGWFGQLITSQDMTKIDMLQKMLKNTEGSKRLTWIPNEYRENPKDWYKDKKCVLDKSIRDAFSKVLEAEAEKQEKLILEFSKRYVEYVAKNRENGLKKLKENNPDFLDDVFLGFSQMAGSTALFMQNMMKNTPDDKVEEIVADKIISNRKRREAASTYKSKQELEKEESEGKEVSTEKKLNKPKVGKDNPDSNEKGSRRNDTSKTSTPSANKPAIGKTSVKTPSAPKNDTAA